MFELKPPHLLAGGIECAVIPLGRSSNPRIMTYTMAQCNPTVERGPDRKPKIKPLPKEKAENKTTQAQGKDKSH